LWYTVHIYIASPEILICDSEDIAGYYWISWCRDTSISSCLLSFWTRSSKSSIHWCCVENKCA
jgi:hypothetical protein